MTTPARRRHERGFTVIEMLVATAIMMVVTGAVFSLMNPAHGTFQAQPEVSDMQQRVRVAVEALQRDLIMAGAGTYSGTKQGSLGNFFATILPDREGSATPDPPGTFKCTTNFCDALDGSDTITIMYVPPTPAQTTIRDEMPAQAVPLKVEHQAGCPDQNHAALCGFKAGMQLLIFDETGTYDTFTVSSVADEALQIRHQGTVLSKTYAPGSWVTQVKTATFYLKTDTATNTYQLMYYDGDQADQPIVENVVGLAFEYFGDPAPPTRTSKPLSDPKGPWTNYGPKPTASAGNCIFDLVNGFHVAKATMPSLGTGPLVKLGKSKLTDGPWCPDSSTESRYDADLLRIRKVKVTLRVQVGKETLRGADTTLFLRPGSSRGSEQYIPDLQLAFDVTPRNLNFGR